MTSPFDNGMNPAQRKSIDATLRLAVQSWDLDLIKATLQSGADPQPLLPRAIEKQSAEMIKLAAEFGANLNEMIQVKEGQYQMPLHMAHTYFHQDVVRQMILSGCPVDQKNPKGETVALVAVKAGDFDKMRFYLEQGADLSENVQDVLLGGISKKDKATVEWALEKGADLNGRLLSGEQTISVIHYASQSFDPVVMELLLAKGTNVHALTGLGRTPLHIAVEKSDAALVTFLLDKKADPMAADRLGVTPVDLAMTKLAEAEKAVANDRYDSYSRSSSSSTTARDKAKGIVTTIIERVKQNHLVDPYKAATSRDVKAAKAGGVAFRKKTQEP